MIDILLATYNGEKYLDTQIASIVNQSYKDWILYIHDDGSSDNTVILIQKWCDLDKRIIFVNDGIYEEIEMLYKLPKKESAEILDKMFVFLKEHNMPKHYGLNETNIVFRHHNDSVIKKIMEEWWFFISSISKRDQVSLSYVLWKNNIKPRDIAIANARKSSHFFITDCHETLVYNCHQYYWNTNHKVWTV